MNDTRQDLPPTMAQLAAIANQALLLSEHLRERWPIQGRGQPAAGPPTTITFSDLYRYLLNLKTILFHFHPPTNRAEEGVWLRLIMPVLGAPGVADALKQIDLACDHVIEQFGIRDRFSSVDGHFKAVLTPTLTAAQRWQPPDGRSIPVIDPQEVGMLAWAAAKLCQALGEGAAGQVQAPASEGGAGRSAEEAEEGATGGADPATTPRYLFARLPDGRYRIAYGGKEDTIPGKAGLRVVEYLLKQPGKAAHVLEINRALCEGDPRVAAAAEAFPHSGEQKGLDGFTADALRPTDPCSEEDLEKAKEALQSLDDQAAKARDGGLHQKAEELERQAELARRWIREQETLAARKRRGQPDRDSEVEKVRLKLTNNFTNACKALRIKYGFSELADHLEEQIDRGAEFKYRPAPGVEWAFDPRPC
jgi:hypothetical protein